MAPTSRTPYAAIKTNGPGAGGQIVGDVAVCRDGKQEAMAEGRPDSVQTAAESFHQRQEVQTLNGFCGPPEDMDQDSDH